MESDFTLALRVVEVKETRRSCASGLGYLRRNLLPAHTVRHHDSWSCCAVARFRKRTSTQNMCVYHCLLRFPKSHSHSDHRIYWMVKIALTQFLYMTCCSLSPEPVES